MGTPVDWIPLFNRTFEIINNPGACYFSGPCFLRKVREIDPYFANYDQYFAERKRTRKNTTREKYFFDILMAMDEPKRVRLLNAILDEVERHAGDKVREVRSLLRGKALAPKVVVPQETWGAERLNGYLKDIDNKIDASNYKEAIALSYTCLEGFYKAFVRQRIPHKADVREITALSKEIKGYLQCIPQPPPGEVLNVVSHITHAVNCTRNERSTAHFKEEKEEADRWLAIYIRDLMNTQIHLLLHFM